MHKLLVSASLAALLAAPAALAAQSGAEADFHAAYTAAEQEHRQALAKDDGWTVTESALAEANKAAKAGDFDKALAFAKQAKALADAALYQIREQEARWHDAVVH